MAIALPMYPDVLGIQNILCNKTKPIKSSDDSGNSIRVSNIEKPTQNRDS